MGQFAIQYLKLLADAHVIAVDPNEWKRNRALELGADEAVSPGDPLPPAQVVLDFVGSDESLRLARSVVDQTGIVVQVGEAGGRLPFGLGAVPHEAHFTTSIWGSLDDLKEVLALARKGNLHWEVETLPRERAAISLASPAASEATSSFERMAASW